MNLLKAHQAAETHDSNKLNNESQLPLFFHFGGKFLYLMYRDTCRTDFDVKGVCFTTDLVSQ